MGLTALLTEALTQLIEWGGYWGVALLMLGESMIAPIPSEAVMPFAGRLVAQGIFTWQGVLVSSTLGTILGSGLSYAMGYYGGRPLVRLLGRYLLLNESHLDKTAAFFARRGGITVLAGRFIPVVRHLISVPAGMGRMHLIPFFFFTALGGTIWNMFLAWVGYRLSDYAEVLHRYRTPIDVVVVLILSVGGLWFIRQHMRPAARPQV